jgi:phage gp36-like protein
MRQFVAPTEDAIKLGKGVLNADASAGDAVSLTLVNNAGFEADNYVVIGWEGSENAELCRISTDVTPGTAIVVATLLRAHKAGEPVTVYRYNQRKFYGALTVDGEYTELTDEGSPKDIDVNNPQGTIFEYNGSEGYLYFKSTYYHSRLDQESDIDQSEGVASDQTARYATIYDIKRQAGLSKNPYITDDIVEKFRKRAENEINSYLYAKYNIPLMNSDDESEVPFIIENCCTLLAAGYMDWQEYGKEGEGAKWLGEARSLLKAIQKGTQKLIGLDGIELSTKSSTQGVASYPDTVDNDEGPIQMFTTRQQF